MVQIGSQIVVYAVYRRFMMLNGKRVYDTVLYLGAEGDVGASGVQQLVNAPEERRGDGQMVHRSDETTSKV